MVRLRCDHGDTRDVHARQFLGEESPVEFEGGYAEVDDEAGAAHLVRSDPHIEYAPEPDTCQEVLQSGTREGEVCGEDLPCRYHS